MVRWQKVTALMVVLIFGLSFTLNNKQSRYFEISKNIEIFTRLYEEINTYYVDEIDPGKLMRTGLDAMMESLDPFTNYISESDIEGYRYMTEGRYNGIGATMEPIKGKPTIMELYEGQPADKGGLKVGDRLIAVDGKTTEGRSVDDIHEIMRGFPGTEVELTIERPGESSPKKLKIVREEVEVPNVPYYGMVSEDIGYVTLTTFTREAGANVANAVKKLREDHPNIKGLIFDLRGNGGGLLNEAVNIANIFIPRNEVVVTTKGKVKDWDRSFKTMGNPVELDLPMAVLINKGSASASEIVSGVIQDLDRGVLIGQLSYGKGLVQNTKDIGYNAKLKLTTAKYYIPSGRCIQAVSYKDGEPVHIPENQRAQFKTRNGRTVLDGGGVLPDIQLTEASDIPVIKQLLDQHLVFDYVTEFVQKHPKIDSVQAFRFTAFDEFMSFLQKRGFDYQTGSEKALAELKEKIKTEGLDAETELKALTTKIDKKQENELQAAKPVLIKVIEKEIAGRYYYEDGRIKMSLRNDDEVAEAIRILHSEQEYKKLLAQQ